MGSGLVWWWQGVEGRGVGCQCSSWLVVSCVWLSNGLGSENALRGQWQWLQKCTERTMAMPPTGVGTEDALRGQWRWHRKCTERTMGWYGGCWYGGCWYGGCWYGGCWYVGSAQALTLLPVRWRVLVPGVVARGLLPGSRWSPCAPGGRLTAVLPGVVVALAAPAFAAGVFAAGCESQSPVVPGAATGFSLPILRGPAEVASLC